MGEGGRKDEDSGDTRDMNIAVMLEQTSPLHQLIRVIHCGELSRV